MARIEENWSGELTAGGKSLAEVKIQRGIFQGYALLPLLFVRGSDDVIQSYTQEMHGWIQTY